MPKDQRRSAVGQQTGILDAIAAQPLFELARQPGDKDPIGLHQTFPGVNKRLTLIAIALTACSAASPAPKGWMAIPGSSDAWSRGSGVAREEYSYSRKTFPGTLQDLASAVAIDTLLHNPGGKLRSSDPFAPCPGAAGVATLSLRGGSALREGFAVHDGVAVRTSYTLPAGAQPDANVIAAMQNVLC